MHFKRPVWTVQEGMMCLTAQGYEDDSENWAEVGRLIIQTKAYVKYHETK